jgi:translation initiation factor 2D
VISKLQSGADLMTPGLAGGPPFPEKAKKGSIVAIASIESPSVPLVVGCCEIDVSALGKVQGAKGQAVQSITWCGDELWAWSTGGKSGSDAPHALEEWLKPDQVDEVTERTERLAIDKDSVPEDKLTNNASQVQENPDTEGPLGTEGAESAQDRVWTTKGALNITKYMYLTNQVRHR